MTTEYSGCQKTGGQKEGVKIADCILASSCGRPASTPTTRAPSGGVCGDANSRLRACPASRQRTDVRSAGLASSSRSTCGTAGADADGSGCGGQKVRRRSCRSVRGQSRGLGHRSPTSGSRGQRTTPQRRLGCLDVTPPTGRRFAVCIRGSAEAPPHPTRGTIRLSTTPSILSWSGPPRRGGHPARNDRCRRVPRLPVVLLFLKRANDEFDERRRDEIRSLRKWHRGPPQEAGEEADTPNATRPDGHLRSRRGPLGAAAGAAG